MNFINWNLLGNPANLLIIFLILYLAALLAQVIYQASQGQSLLNWPSLPSAS